MLTRTESLTPCRRTSLYELLVAGDEGELCVLSQGDLPRVVASGVGVVNRLLECRLHRHVALVLAFSVDG